MTSKMWRIKNVFDINVLSFPNRGTPFSFFFSNRCAHLIVNSLFGIGDNNVCMFVCCFLLFFMYTEFNSIILEMIRVTKDYVFSGQLEIPLSGDEENTDHRFVSFSMYINIDRIPQYQIELKICHNNSCIFSFILIFKPQTSQRQKWIIDTMSQ